MTREDIIRLAREAGFTVDDIFGVPYALLNEMTFYNFNDALVRFANLVAAAEREACREIAFRMAHSDADAVDVSHAIRARGET